MNSQNTLSEFKEFCKQNILQDLFRLERERKQVLASVIISSVIFLLIITFISQLFIIKIPDLDYFTFIYSGDMSVSLPAFLLTRLFSLLVYLIFFLKLFVIWSLFYNSAFESFSSSFEKQVNEKIFEFIKNQNNLNISTKTLNKDVDETILRIQYSQIFNGLFSTLR